MGVVLDYEPCDKCREKRKLGVTLMEVVDHPLSDTQPEIQNGIWPTGKWCVIKKEAADRMFSGYLNNKNALFVDQEIFTYVMGGAAVP